VQVSASLSHILRLPFSGPKIAQKYLHQPVLFNRPEIGDVKAFSPDLNRTGTGNNLEKYRYSVEKKTDFFIFAKAKMSKLSRKFAKFRFAKFSFSRNFSPTKL
jgi:hypothetical protein